MNKSQSCWASSSGKQRSRQIMYKPSLRKMPAQSGTYLMAKESQVFLGGRHPPQSNAAFAASLSTQSQAVFAGSFPTQSEEDFAVPLPPESEDNFVTLPAPAQTNTVFTGLLSTQSNAAFTGSHPAQSKEPFPGYFPAQTKAVFPGSLPTQSKEALTRLQPTESKGATAVPHPSMQNAPPEWNEMIQRHIAAAQWAESGKYQQEKMKQQERIYHFQEQQNKNTVHTLYNQYEEKIRPCIDLIDSLRALGVEKDLALPAIAVIGDQSSGKSSVLEALSGVALPRGSGITTRCPLVLRLKKLAPQQEWKGKISYRNIDEELHHPSAVDNEIRKAQNAIAGEGVGISQELISLEISSPNVPDLTLIDLPGIARVAVGNQPQDIGEQIKKLIKKFIAKQETINLVVVPSNVDIATTEALKMAQEVDPDGERTLGILTKPDLVDRGTESSVVDIVQNLVIHLRKGYMIVKCRGQQDIHDKLTLASAIQKERAFFEQHEHFRVLLDENKATIPILAEKLTTELVEHINKSLPALEEQINIQLQKATQELLKYGKGTPKAEDEKLFFLIDKIKLFNQDIVSSAVGEEKLFENEIRLFTKIRTEFQKWGKILDDSALTDRKTIQHEVCRFEEQYRGRELPGFTSYKTFEAIVRQRVMALEKPAIEMLKKVIEIVRKSFTDVAKDHFEDFQNLNRAAKDRIEDISKKQAEEAETIIRIHFKMEQLVYCQDNVYRQDLKVIREETPTEAANGLNPASLSFNFGTVQNHPAVKDMTYHLEAYFNSAGKRLSNQIPLIIQFYILQDFGDKLQNSMLQLLQEKEKLSFFLQERNDAAEQRHFLSGRIHRLTQARLRLMKSSVL
ncbi:interferon-induced GTP-binding protein Mx2-like [Malaclemys terrapin pileata]|uniref:interferon-induced GTP-binding protein Mx2-like n=1 Tax=Malaclemys terrapin pileata TaxID=2991368 RepID=UPI0023A8CA2F|nr:interferon-induced GTP-binding protein Mx2-like [Malaclemys terrapin pileata]XP_053905458.1 interferon-induced GTP-binding protein Mx2-like [Malaclemys terrapin pileata]